MDGYNVASLIITIMQAILINGSNLNPNFISYNLCFLVLMGLDYFQGC